MESGPSFFHLYQRGCCCREGKPNVGQRQNQRELFAVAALAFTLKHSEQFRRYFLCEICGIQTGWSNPALQIRLQPENYADLALIIPELGSVGVIEAKIDAPLEDHQNQNKDEFWEEGGYGRQILGERDFRDLPQNSVCTCSISWITPGAIRQLCQRSIARYFERLTPGTY